MIIDKIVCHHTGGTLSDPYWNSQHLTAVDIDAAHKARFDFKSSLGRYGGYHLFIPAEGGWTQFRAIGETTAAVRGMNTGTISIALAGNFTLKPDGVPVNMPTFAQLQTLKNLILILNDNVFIQNKIVALADVRVSVKFADLKPHRAYNLTQCFGNALPDNYVQTLMYNHFKDQLTVLQRILVNIAKLLEPLQKASRERKALAGIGAYADSCWQGLHID